MTRAIPVSAFNVRRLALAAERVLRYGFLLVQSAWTSADLNSSTSTNTSAIGEGIEFRGQAETAAARMAFLAKPSIF
jgi:hypothetical protein